MKAIEELQDENQSLKEEILVLQSDLNEALDCTVESLLEKYMKTYYKRKKVWLDTDKIVIREFLSYILCEKYNV